MLGQVIASFAAFQAVILAVFAEPHRVRTLAKGAVFVTIAFFFYLFANHATESFGHGRRVARNSQRRKGLLTTKEDTKDREPLVSLAVRFFACLRIIDPWKMRVLTYKVALSC